MLALCVDGSCLCVSALQGDHRNGTYFGDCRAVRVACLHHHLSRHLLLLQVSMFLLSLTTRSYFSQCLSSLLPPALTLVSVSPLSYHPLLLQCVPSLSYPSLLLQVSVCVSSLLPPLLLQSVCIFSLLPPALTSVCIFSLLPPALTSVSVCLLSLTTRSYFTSVCVSSLLSYVTSGTCDCVFSLYGHPLLLSTGPHVRSHCS